jgi:hypothetical protein
MHNVFTRVGIPALLSLGAITLRATPAAAVTSYAEVTFTNNTPCAVDLASAAPGGEWYQGSPPASVGSHQTVHWGTDSNHGGWFSGTGGKVVISLPTSTESNGDFVVNDSDWVKWSIPWGYFNGSLPWSSANGTQGDNGGIEETGNGAATGHTGTLYSLDQGAGGCGGNGVNTCEFVWTLNFHGASTNCSITPQSVILPTPPSGTVPGVLTSYFDTTHGAEYVFYLDYGGAIDALSCGPSGCWQSQVVAPEGWYSPGSSLISYFDGVNGHLFFQGTSGSSDILELKGNPPSSTGTVTNVTAQSNGSPGAVYYNYTAGSTTVDGILPASNLTGFWDGHTDHVFYEDSGANIHEAYYNGAWWDGVVAPANALPYGPAGVLRSVWDGTDEMIFYPLYGYNVQESVPFSAGLGATIFASGAWSSKSISLPNYPSADLFATSPGSGTAVVIGGIGQNLLQQVTRRETQTTKQPFPETEQTTPNFMPSLPILSFSDSQGNQIFYVGTDQHIHHFAGSNSAVDMSTAPGNDGSLAALNNTGTGTATPLSGFFDGTNDHVFFINTNNNVEEFYWQAPNGGLTEHLIGGARNAVGLGWTTNAQK